MTDLGPARALAIQLQPVWRQRRPASPHLAMTKLRSTAPLLTPKQAATRATPLIPAVGGMAKARQAVAIRVQVARTVAIRATTKLTAAMGTVLRTRAAAATIRAERGLVVRTRVEQ